MMRVTEIRSTRADLALGELVITGIDDAGATVEVRVGVPALIAGIYQPASQIAQALHAGAAANFQVLSLRGAQKAILPDGREMLVLILDNGIRLPLLMDRNSKAGLRTELAKSP